MAKARKQPTKKDRQDRALLEANRGLALKISKMIVFEFAQSCGCCSVEMHFSSEEEMKAAISPLGLTSTGVVIDGLGVRHEGIDTFYGYRTTGKRVRKPNARDLRRVLNSLQAQEADQDQS